MSDQSEINCNRERLVNLLYRLRPGDDVVVTTTSGTAWSEGRSMQVRKILLQRMSSGDEYYCILAKGPRMDADGGGGYILMPEKPDQGLHTAPEGWHYNADADLTSISDWNTGGPIINLELS